ncbi:MAG: hypothetical protein IT179_12795 [Acidobacteria bacterium]|nr:hypothetical protein [Acidobacteriota bacterium]
MSTNRSSSIGVQYADTALSGPRRAGASGQAAVASAADAERRQRTGQRMILAGFVIAIAGVVAYCVASFGAGMSTAMEGVLFDNDVPFARATLAVLGLGTLVWLAGSITYLRGALDADEEAGEAGTPHDRQA